MSKSRKASTLNKVRSYIRRGPGFPDSKRRAAARWVSPTRRDALFMKMNGKSGQTYRSVCLSVCLSVCRIVNADAIKIKSYSVNCL